MAAPQVDDALHAAATDGADDLTEDAGLIGAIIGEIFGSYINMTLVVVIGVLLYKILRGRNEESHRRSTPPAPQLPKLRRDFTIQELKPFDGTQADGRVLMAVNGTVYDVTKGKSFYGPGGPYAAFAGRDASRGLATFNVKASDDDTYDDLSDLSNMEMDSVKEWEMQFNEKYLVVGKLLKPGEQATSYSDEEEDSSAADATPGTPAAAKPATPIVNVDARGESTASSSSIDASKPKAE